MSFVVLLRGGGDLASGVALRLHRAGLKVLITELHQPLVVRRWVAFAEAVYGGSVSVEDVTACRVSGLEEANVAFQSGKIPVLVDPMAEVIADLKPAVLVDGRMTKQPPEIGMKSASLVVGLGPGFQAGLNCHAVIETRRGPHMGRVIWQGMSDLDTGIPESVGSVGGERVLRAPASGILTPLAEIGDILEKGDPVAEIDGQIVVTPFRGLLRGLLHSGVFVKPGLKIGDLDPRLDKRLCSLVSDKSLSVGGGVLEAVFSRSEFRPYLWS